MAEITCVFRYDANTGKVSIVNHVMTVDAHDKINFVTDTPGLTLQSEIDFDYPLLQLRKGDLAPVKYTLNVPETRGVPEIKVYYHGPVWQFACGTLDGGYGFQAWPRGVGQRAPGD